MAWFNTDEKIQSPSSPARQGWRSLGSMDLSRRAVDEEAFNFVPLAPIQEKRFIIAYALAISQSEPAAEVANGRRLPGGAVGQVELSADGNRHLQSFYGGLGELNFEAVTDECIVVFAVSHNFRIRGNFPSSVYHFHPAFQLRPRGLIGQIQGHFHHAPNPARKE